MQPRLIKHSSSNLLKSSEQGNERVRHENVSTDRNRESFFVEVMFSLRLFIISNTRYPYVPFCVQRIRNLKEFDPYWQDDDIDVRVNARKGFGPPSQFPKIFQEIVLLSPKRPSRAYVQDSICQVSRHLPFNWKRAHYLLTCRPLIYRAMNFSVPQILNVGRRPSLHRR